MANSPKPIAAACSPISAAANEASANVPAVIAAMRNIF
jgi:hypothetical protein